MFSWRSKRSPTIRLAPTLAQASPPSQWELGDREQQAGVLDADFTYDLVSTSEAARILGISAHGVRDLVRRGQLPAHNTGTRWLLPARLVVARAERQAAHRAV